ncbi:MAG: gamma-glutamyltransferase family protein [Vulcanimicrobiaceae bacterium]
MLAPPRLSGHPTRAVARSIKGMIASPHALASAEGARILREGGNAVDAAIAANGVLSVVYPHANGLGGDAFWMIYEPRTGGVVCYNGSGRAPKDLDAAQLRARGKREMPARGALPVTVPGAVRAWEDVAAKHGTRGLDALLAAAESYARDGYVVTEVVAYYLALNETVLAKCQDAAALFLRGGLPTAGTVLRNPGLARAIAELRAGGAEAFYGGAAGRAIVARLNAGGSPMTLDDLRAHRTQVTKPWRLPWAGGEMLAHPPNSHGSCAQIVLGALEGDRTSDEGLWMHLAIEAFKHAFYIRDTRFGDPDFVKLDEREFLSPPALRAIRATIEPDRVTAEFRQPDAGDTVAIVVADDEGLVVSLIQSLYMNFGSAIVAGESGIVLQNRGAYFNLIEGHPNELRGGHRPVHTLSPGMYVRDGKPVLTHGSMGGDGQPQIHVQLLRAVVERGLDVQSAIDAPRWIAGRPHVPGREDVMTDTVVVESRMPDEVVDGLTRRGHKVELLGEFDHTMGHAQAIFIDRERGTFSGGSDPRADSLALGV